MLFRSTPWTAAYQAPPSMGFFRQEFWSGVPLASLNDPIGDAAAAAKSLSRVRLFATPGTIQSLKFSRPEHWSG